MLGLTVKNICFKNLIQVRGRYILLICLKYFIKLYLCIYTYIFIITINEFTNLYNILFYILYMYLRNMYNVYYAC